jgi:hypothetical protein
MRFFQLEDGFFIKSVFMKKFSILSVVVFIAVACSFSTNKNDSSGSKPDDHPRLIITRENIAEMHRRAETTHKHLYELSIRLADDFAREVPPEAGNANNRLRRLGESLPSLGLAYLLTREDKYLDGANKWIRALLAVESWEGSANLGRSAWITGVAQTYDWLYPYLDNDLKDSIVTRLKKEAQIVMNTAARTRALSNHLMIETSALGTVGLILEDNDPDREKFLTQANEWTEYIIQNAPLDGSWGEGVQYWQYGLGYFLRYL